MSEKKYRKKPVEIEAMQWPGRDGTTFDDWLTADDHRRVAIKVSGEDDDPHLPFTEGDLLIETLEGVMRAEPGDWVIRGVKGELYPCKPDIFEATYEAATAPSQDVTERAAAVLQARMSWPSAEACAQDLASAGLLRGTR